MRVGTQWIAREQRRARSDQLAGRIALAAAALQGAAANSCGVAARRAELASAFRSCSTRLGSSGRRASLGLGRRARAEARWFNSRRQLRDPSASSRRGAGSRAARRALGRGRRRRAQARPDARRPGDSDQSCLTVCLPQSSERKHMTVMNVVRRGRDVLARTSPLVLAVYAGALAWALTSNVQLMLLCLVVVLLISASWSWRDAATLSKCGNRCRKFLQRFPQKIGVALDRASRPRFCGPRNRGSEVRILSGACLASRWQPVVAGDFQGSRSLLRRAMAALARVRADDRARCRIRPPESRHESRRSS